MLTSALGQEGPIQHGEPPRVCRRLKLLRGVSDDKQNNEQVFPGSAHACGASGLDHESEHSSRWAAIVSIADKIGCTAQTLNEWVKKVKVDSGRRVGDVPI